jgi:hypothetical protein
MSALQWATAAAVLAFLWLLTYRYSRKHYNFLACQACKGTGKIWEPVWMAWACLRRRRAFRLCTSCGGSARYERRGAVR